ncbi:tRNA-guanine transglycosylase [Spirulina subsalsa]|uniref:tRNA-guanine transglycosylase n=1 Tax=Spirulina subsalsa TaxID=54311 RepID=UPI00031CBD0D|nr:tRNA-guanine transglycosylase [Spirulina subsalsa]
MFNSQDFEYGRLGSLKIQDYTIQTPFLFPVVCLVTSTKASGGGIWKYILHANNDNGLLTRNIPVMSQVLHFLNFIAKKYKGVETWRKLGIKRRYLEDSGVQYNAPIFLDSGGFQLLSKKNIDLSPYGLCLDEHQGFQSILNLQKDFGGNIIASLDYPIHPKLIESEAKERINKSLFNAIEAALLLQKSTKWNPFFYVAVHGQSRQQIEYYVRQVFKKINHPIGLAIGSLVPLRGAKKYEVIVDLLRGVKNSIPEDKKNITPIHIFGITGTLIPLLSYLGVDTFDSSSYVQEARSLSYLDPHNRIPHPILEMDNIICNCQICQKANLKHIQEAFISDVKGRPVHHGYYKSKYYADLALHNLEMDFNLVQTTKAAIRANELQEYIIEYTSQIPHLRSAVNALAYEDQSLQTRLSRVVVTCPRNLEVVDNQQIVSLKYKPEDFNISQKSFQPSDKKRILLIIPCSGGKPYSQSRSHRFIKERLEKNLSDRQKLIHKVTLSGLYGPVPEEYEQETQIVEYDFQLDPLDEVQIDLVAKRLTTYLECYKTHYHVCIAYATSKAYRIVIEKTAKEFSNLVVLPDKPKSRRLTEFFRKENVAELVEKIKSVLNEVELG